MKIKGIYLLPAEAHWWFHFERYVLPSLSQFPPCLMVTPNSLFIHIICLFFESHWFTNQESYLEKTSSSKSVAVTF
jgi:hypothetical protein